MKPRDTYYPDVHVTEQRTWSAVKPMTRRRRRLFGKLAERRWRR